MKKLIADFIWSLIKDRVLVMLQEQQQQQQPAQRPMSKYAGGGKL